MTTTTPTTTTRMTTPFDGTSTASDVIAGTDLSGKRAVVTGSSSGIGVETARALAGAGAEVTLAVRNPDAGAHTAAKITASLPGAAGRVLVSHLDLADRASVAQFLTDWAGPLHILVNNAGVMAIPLHRSPEGWEGHFTTNHLGHFALATGLHGALAAAQGARVVVVSSAGNLLSPVIFDDLHFRYRPYDPWAGYAQSKTANVLFAVGAAHRWADDGITANALMPGNIASTALGRHVTPELYQSFTTLEGVATPPEKTVEQGAATSILLAASPLLAEVTGRYFEDCAEAEVVPDGNGWGRGVAPYALDPANADRLWNLSEHLVNGS